MADYRIVCIERAYGGVGHIVAVGTGTDPSTANNRLTVAEVRNALKQGDTFHTVGSDGRKAYVEAWDIPGIRTKPDASTKDNLESLRVCGGWKS